MPTARHTITCFALCCVHASGQDLRITEIMANSHISGDWFELTNAGQTSINLEGYSWDDRSALPGTVPFPSHTLNPGASLIYLIQPALGDFKDWWELDESTSVLLPENYEETPRFRFHNDELNLFSPENVLIDTIKYSGVFQVGRSHARLSDGAWIPFQEIHLVRHRFRESQNPRSSTKFWLYDRGTPGEVSPAFRFRPQLTKKANFQQWHHSSDLIKSDFRLRAFDPNPGDTLTITGDDLPEWLTLDNESNGVARFLGTPPPDSVGRHTFDILVTDNTGKKSFPYRDYTIDILPTKSPIILNEYNAVSYDQFLGGGEENDPDGDHDFQIGRVAGNGGLWAEFVVVGSGVGPEKVDIRGWRFEFNANYDSYHFQLTDNPAFATIPAGTILTFTDLLQTSATLINDTARTMSDGYFWTNIHLHDTNFVTIHVRSDNFDQLNQWNRQLEVRVLLPDGKTLMGTAGEKVARRDPDEDGIFEKKIKLGTDEVFKLESDATPDISPIFGNYDDGETSTFGRPNEWNSRQSTQNFSQYIPSNLPPVITGNPSGFCAGSRYQSEFLVTDPNDDPVTIALAESPDFLTITQPTPGAIRLELNREILKSDIGDHVITVSADDGGEFPHLGYFTYKLTVVDPEPTVIVNEINTVAKGGYLNGGNKSSDSDGAPPATDSNLGRIRDNGGDWFELVVVGDGGPSLVDLRGWKIEIGSPDLLGDFAPISYLQLNQHSQLAAVPAGTLLLFYETSFHGETDPRFTDPDSESIYTQGWQTIHFPISLASGKSRYLSSGRSKNRAVAIDLDANNTQIRILDSNNRSVFGPCGEGVVPNVKVGNDEIFELEAHPSPQISILDSGSLAGARGYDDSDSESTFGQPNRFSDLDGNLISQDFTRYLPPRSSYKTWAAGFGLAEDSANDDSDGDNASNINEYFRGTSPTVALDRPPTPAFSFDEALNLKSFTFNVRVNDPDLSGRSELSFDLRNWTTDGLRVVEVASNLGPAFRARSVAYYVPDQFEQDLFSREVYFRHTVTLTPSNQ